MGGLFGRAGGQNQQSPALAGIKIQSSTYGLPVPIVWGQNRIQGNLIWYGDFTTTSHNQASGGKGGGAMRSSTSTYTYNAALVIGLCEGPINGIGTIWKNSTQMAAGPSNQSIIYNGDYAQTPWGYLTTKHAGQDLAYKGLAYAGYTMLQLDSSAALPNLNFEVKGRFQFGGGIVDANPKDVLSDFLTNVNYGALWPSNKVGDLTQYSAYCVANGLFISPALTSQKPAHESIKALMQMTNSEVFFSEGVLKVVPYGDKTVTGNGVTFTPNVTPIYNLADGDFKGDKKDPVNCARSTPADAFDQVMIEFLDRSNNYKVTMASAIDQANVELYGLRPMPVIQMHGICDPAVARSVAQLILQRALYIRNTYTFKLGWKYCLLEPMDIVTVTDTALGINNAPVRITVIEEDEIGMLTVTAEEYPAAVCTHALYPNQVSGGYNANYNASPGNVNAPVFFEAPDILTDFGLEVWMAVSGGTLWGGCEVWVSKDNATFKRVGDINGPARHGLLTAALPAAADPDRTDTLAVDLSVSGGQLTSGTQDDADRLYNLCYADNELISFQTATLTAANKYNLSYLRRGAYGTTIAQHQAGTQFARLDQRIFRFPFTQDMIGNPIYVKFLSFNIYGGGIQALADVQAYTYTIQGTALKSPLPNVQNLVSYLQNGQMWLSWNPVKDFRPLVYEVRKGASWAGAEVMGRTSITDMPTEGDGTYWVAALAGLAYSQSPTSIVIAGSVLVKNIIAAIDEAAEKWPGIFVNTSINAVNEVFLTGTQLFSTISSVSAAPTIVFAGGVASSGSYEIPAADIVDIGFAQKCTISVNYNLRSDNPFNPFSTIPDVAMVASLNGNYAGLSDAQIQINIAQNDGVFTGWNNFMAGQYVGRKFKFRAVLTSADPLITAVLSGMSFKIDMPDRVDNGTNVSVPPGGAIITFVTPFHNANPARPNIQVSVLNAQQNDTVSITNPGNTGFSIQILNGGAGVPRTIDWTAQGY